MVPFTTENVSQLIDTLSPDLCDLVFSDNSIYPPCSDELLNTALSTFSSDLSDTDFSSSAASGTDSDEAFSNFKSLDVLDLFDSVHDPIFLDVDNLDYPEFLPEIFLNQKTQEQDEKLEYLRCNIGYDHSYSMSPYDFDPNRKIKIENENIGDNEDIPDNNNNSVASESPAKRHNPKFSWNTIPEEDLIGDRYPRRKSRKPIHGFKWEDEEPNTSSGRKRGPKKNGQKQNRSFSSVKQTVPQQVKRTHSQNVKQTIPQYKRTNSQYVKHHTVPQRTSSQQVKQAKKPRSSTKRTKQQSAEQSNKRGRGRNGQVYMYMSPHQDTQYKPQQYKPQPKQRGRKAGGSQKSDEKRKEHNFMERKRRENLKFLNEGLKFAIPQDCYKVTKRGRANPSRQAVLDTARYYVRRVYKCLNNSRSYNRKILVRILDNTEYSLLPYLAQQKRQNRQPIKTNSYTNSNSFWRFR